MGVTANVSDCVSHSDSGLTASPKYSKIGSGLSHLDSFASCGAGMDLNVATFDWLRWRDFRSIRGRGGRS